MKAIIIIVCIFLISCQVSEKKQKKQELKPIATFENALVYFRAGDYEKSQAAISMYLEEFPQTTKLVQSLYLKGRTQRLLGQAEACLETFQILIDLTKIKKDSYYNYSLYQQGICYEALGKINEAVAVYQDALRSEKALPAQLKDLEIPSRLALSYSRLGEEKSASNYYKKLQKSLKEYLPKKEFTNEEKQFYAEILFSMSEQNFSIQDTDDLEASLGSSLINRETLFQLLNLNLEPYTKRGLKSYIENYKKMYNYLALIKINESLDPIVQERGRQLFQSKMAASILESIDGFEVALIPEAQSQKYQAEFSELQDIKMGLEKMVGQKLIGDGPTQEAQAREKLKKQGQVIDEPTVLEQNSDIKKNFNKEDNQDIKEKR